MRSRKLATHAFAAVFPIMLALIVAFLPFYTRGERIVMDAMRHLGEPYVFAKAGENEFDCSGLIVYCFGKIGVPVAHFAEEIGYNKKYATIGAIEALRVGDIVCFDTIDDNDLSDHVGIYIGANEFIHASSKQQKVVISAIEGFYLDTYSWGKRIICPYF